MKDHGVWQEIDGCIGLSVISYSVDTKHIVMFKAADSSLHISYSLYVTRK
jgi:hypothetical protein